MKDLDLNTLCPGCLAAKGRANPCPHCGYDETAPRGAFLLPHRTLLNGQFLVGRVLGKPGGFGITYLGWDLNLQTRVAIKEYLPRELAGRATDRATVAPHTQDEGEQFHYGLEQFLREARTLAQIDHPNIVRVRQFFEANGTAYLVMDYYQGISLAEHLERQGGRLPEEQAKQVMLPILDGLRAVHAKHFLHRDIKPQNIYLARIDSGGTRPILLDFGAARQAMGERSRSLSVVVSAGYAPFEQYHRKGNQGPWTDIYSAAVVIYRLVTGVTPPEATERRDVDLLKPAAAFGVSKPLSDALSEALSLAPEQRPQTVRGFQARLWGIGVAPQPGPAPGPAAPTPPSVPAQPPARSAPSAPPKARKTSAHSTAPASALPRWLWPAALGAAVAVVSLGGLYMHREGQLRKNSSDRSFEAAQVADTDFASKAREADLAAYAAAEKADTVEAYQSYLVGCVANRCAKSADVYANLGVIYATGRGVQQDDREAVKWLRKAAEQGNAVAQWDLGLMYAQGRGVAQSDGEAAKWYRKAAEQGNAFGQCFLGAAYDQGRGLAQSDADALKWYRKAAEQGNADGQFFLGAMYAEGRGVAQNDTEAAKWYRKAAEQGNAFGQYELARMYAIGRGVAQNDAEAVTWCRKAAEQGNAGGQFSLGFMYANGRGVAQDDREAVQWLRKAAEQDNADAQAGLGFMYAQGRGVAQSESEAVTWYRKAAVLGNAFGQFKLGAAYDQGRGVVQSDADAVKWYERAAEQGLADAKARLGAMYAQGRGVPPENRNKRDQ